MLSLLSSEDSDEAENDSDKVSNVATNSDDSTNALPDWKAHGEELILAAALEAGASPKMIQIDWKSDKIVVTVDANCDENYVDGNHDSMVTLMGLDGDFYDEEIDEDVENFEEGEYDVDYEKEENYDELDEEEMSKDNFIDEDYFNEFDFHGDPYLEQARSIDLTRIARSINEALSRDGEQSLGYRIAQMHEIEVTTPEFDNVLRGQRMFESYRGFEVILEYYAEDKRNKNKKKKKSSNATKTNGDDDDINIGVFDGDCFVSDLKLKTIEGKLVCREEKNGVTVVNVKGKIVKIKNELIECVRLPKAKREKGMKD